jgi:hypothetical protein
MRNDGPVDRGRPRWSALRRACGRARDSSSIHASTRQKTGSRRRLSLSRRRCGTSISDIGRAQRHSGRPSSSQRPSAHTAAAIHHGEPRFPLPNVAPARRKQSQHTQLSLFAGTLTGSSIFAVAHRKTGLLLHSVYPDHSLPLKASTAATRAVCPLSARQHSRPDARPTASLEQLHSKSICSSSPNLNLRAPSSARLSRVFMQPRACTVVCATRLLFPTTPHYHLPRSSINCLSMSLHVSPPRQLPLHCGELIPVSLLFPKASSAFAL